MFKWLKNKGEEVSISATNLYDWRDGYRESERIKKEQQRESEDARMYGEEVLRNLLKEYKEYCNVSNTPYSSGFNFYNFFKLLPTVKVDSDYFLEGERGDSEFIHRKLLSFTANLKYSIRLIATITKTVDVSAATIELRLRVGYLVDIPIQLE